MVSGLLPEAPIWDDIKTLCIQPSGNSIDILYGGFPYQDISVAGNGKGLAGERSGLFFEIVRLAKEIKPRFLFLENVPAIRSRGGIEVLKAIAELGYDSRFCVISAASVGALHRRERWFLLAHASGERSQGFRTFSKFTEKKHTESSGSSYDVANTGCNCQGMPKESERAYDKSSGQSRFWEVEPMWVEWLMGYPTGWINLEPWAIAWFLSKRKKRSKS